MQFNISLVLLAVLDREADSSHLVLAKADNFDYIAQSQNILYAVDTLFCDLGNVNHSLFARCKLKECAELGIILEIEIGVVGGEEDGVDNSGHPADKLYTSPEDMLQTYEALAPIGKFMLAATFGNVHGVYKPGHVKLKPSILRDGQDVVAAKHGEDARMLLVFHGGSGSELKDIREAISYGVVKMNIDTDTQYAFSKPIVFHMCEKIEGMLKIDGEVGNKKDYDPRSYLKKGEMGICDRLKSACEDLLSTGKTLCGKI